MQKLSTQEIVSAMELLVGFLKILIIVSLIDPLVLTNIVDMAPLNITQAAETHFLFPKVNHTGEDWLISKPTTVAKKISLDSTASIITVTNLTLGNSKAVNSDDALTNAGMWNLSALMSVSGRDPSLNTSLSKNI